MNYTGEEISKMIYEYQSAKEGLEMNRPLQFSILLLAGTAMLAQTPNQSDSARATIVGYLRDAGCIYRFHEVVKPLPNGCLQACVRSGSPLVILTQKEEVYHPISSEIPETDIREKLLRFAGKLVKITGHVYQRGGSKAITVEQIEMVRE